MLTVNRTSVLMQTQMSVRCTAKYIPVCFLQQVSRKLHYLVVLAMQLFQVKYIKLGWQ